MALGVKQVGEKNWPNCGGWMVLFITTMFKCNWAVRSQVQILLVAPYLCGPMYLVIQNSSLSGKSIHHYIYTKCSHLVYTIRFFSSFISIRYIYKKYDFIFLGYRFFHFPNWKWHEKNIKFVDLGSSNYFPSYKSKNIFGKWNSKLWVGGWAANWLFCWLHISGNCATFV